MKCVFFLAAAMLVSQTVLAERFSAARYGLTPETGYLNAVTEDEVCNPATDVKIISDSVTVGDERHYDLIRKCDGSVIGWVTREVEASQLAPDELNLEQSNQPDVPHLEEQQDVNNLNRLQRLAQKARKKMSRLQGKIATFWRKTLMYLSQDPFDFKIMVGEVYDSFGNDSINIYTCDANRADELKQFPEVTPATDAPQTFKTLSKIVSEGKRARIQLFYNEFIYSGKCIGSIEILN